MRQGKSITNSTVLLVNELFTGEKILEKLANVSQAKSMQSEEVANKQIREFKKLCSKAREAWAFAVFSDSCRESLERYFTYHLQVITDLSEKISTLPDYAVDECYCSPRETCNGFFENEINSLIDHLFRYFGNYPDKNIISPFGYRCHIIRVSQPDVNFIKRSLKNLCLCSNLKSVVITYLDHMENKKESASLSFSQLAYFQKFVTEIKTFLSNVSKCDLTQIFADKLLGLEFNHLEVFGYHRNEINLSIAEKGDNEKLLILKTKADLMLLYKRGDNERYDSSWPKLSIMLSEWLMSEVKVLKEAKRYDQIINVKDNYKFKLELSVAHLACLLRLFIKESMPLTIPLTEIFKFVCDKFRTKRAETLSVGGLSKEYYSVNQITAAEVKDMLLRMIGRINRDFFPVMVAISIIIYAH